MQSLSAIIPVLGTDRRKRIVENPFSDPAALVPTDKTEIVAYVGGSGNKGANAGFQLMGFWQWNVNIFATLTVIAPYTHSASNDDGDPVNTTDQENISGIVELLDADGGVVTSAKWSAKANTSESVSDTSSTSRMAVKNVSWTYGEEKFLTFSAMRIKLSNTGKSTPAQDQEDGGDDQGGGDAPPPDGGDEQGGDDGGDATPPDDGGAGDGKPNDGGVRFDNRMVIIYYFNPTPGPGTDTSHIGVGYTVREVFKAGKKKK